MPGVIQSLIQFYLSHGFTLRAEAVVCTEQEVTKVLERLIIFLPVAGRRESRKATPRQPLSLCPHMPNHVQSLPMMPAGQQSLFELQQHEFILIF